MKNIFRTIVCSAVMALAPFCVNAQGTDLIGGDFPDILIDEVPASTIEEGKTYVLKNKNSLMYLQNSNGLSITSEAPLPYGMPEFFEGYLFSFNADGAFTEDYGKVANYAFDFSVDDGNNPDDVILLSKARAASSVVYFKFFDSASQMLLVKNNTLYGSKEATTDEASKWIAYEAKHVDHKYEKGKCKYCGIDAPYCEIKATGDDVIGTVTGGGRYQLGVSVVLEVSVKNPFYQFVKWSDGDTNDHRTIVVSGDKEYEAIFEPKTYRITAKSADTKMGTVIGSGKYDAGSRARITANPVSNEYRFVKWVEDGNTDNVRDIYMDKDSITLTAQFAKVFTVAAYSNGVGYVTQSTSFVGGKQYVTLLANEIIGTGFVFSQWSNGSKDPEITIEVNEEGTTMVATFVVGVQKVKGDVTGDTVVNYADLTALLSIVMGKSAATTEADINGDKVVDIADVSALINILLGR
ncbi:MAG: dockerin type I domain-containing protein [Bacteroidaceae bacterium]|nr:dockerin type I domain-containing protein [Bacteroidaceae bacterium]